jgi:hypothetical protein
MDDYNVAVAEIAKTAVSIAYRETQRHQWESEADKHISLLHVYRRLSEIFDRLEADEDKLANLARGIEGGF